MTESKHADLKIKVKRLKKLMHLIDVLTLEGFPVPSALSEAAAAIDTDVVYTIAQEYKITSVVLDNLLFELYEIGFIQRLAHK